MTVPSTWSVRRLAGALGAEITGVDIRKVTADEVATIQHLLLEHHVIFLPEQGPTPEEHVGFARHFGHLEGHPKYRSRRGLTSRNLSVSCEPRRHSRRMAYGYDVQGISAFNVNTASR